MRWLILNERTTLRSRNSSLRFCLPSSHLLLRLVKGILKCCTGRLLDRIRIPCKIFPYILRGKLGSENSPVTIEYGIHGDDRAIICPCIARHGRNPADCESFVFLVCGQWTLTNLACPRMPSDLPYIACPPASRDRDTKPSCQYRQFTVYQE